MLECQLMKKILVILGHPSTESFNGAIFEHYIKGARASGHQIRSLELGKLNFDVVFRNPHDQNAKLEPDLKRAQKDILWAEHLVFIYPIWWGNIPALLKGFIDRVFLSGFSHRYLSNGGYEKLLSGRSAHLIVTMDGPTIFESIYLRGSATTRVMKQAVLEFCGIKPVKITRIGQLRKKDKAAREKILEKIAELAG
jgi:putative NADPH-quinone reductase